jgi:hypothetical protein
MINHISSDSDCGVFAIAFATSLVYTLDRWIQILVMGDTIEKVSKSSILTKISILSILAKSIGNSIPLEPAIFLVSIPDQSLNTS